MADLVLTAAAERHHELFEELLAEVAEYNPGVDRELLERAFIFASESGFITAQTLTVDGGRMDYIAHS